jgi:predicted Zn-dependent peptidase
MLVEGDARIDFHTFYNEFIRPGRGIANVVAEVEDDAAEADLNKLLSSIEGSRHGPSRGRPRD